MNMQYGIRLRTEDNLSWPEFCTLVSGLMGDTPLGNVVSIRSEKDPNVLERYTDSQKKIRNDWLMKHGNGANALLKMQGMFKDICGIKN